MEDLTLQIAQEAWKLIGEIEELGGMAAALESGVPKLKIEEAAARKQARIDSGRDVIVGVNQYQVENETDIDIREVDNSKVRISQIERLEAMKAARNKAEVDRCLKNIE